MQSIVKTVLDRFLGPYCDFEGDINVDMWSGKAVLRHVRIKPEVVESVGIPFDIKSGYIDRIGLVCDWRSGFNKPVEVELSHVYAVMSPRSDYSKLDLEKIRKDAMQARRDKKAAELKEWEDGQFDPEKGFVGKLGRRLLRIEPKARKQNAQNAAEYTSPENMTQLEKLIAKIMANLRIKVTDVHIRLESQDNAIGVKISEFSVQTTDELFKPSFVKEIQNTLFKAIALERLSIYVNSGHSVRSTMETQNLTKDEAPASEPQFRYVLRTEFEKGESANLINPVSFTVHVTMQQKPTEKMPKMEIGAYLDDVKMVVKSTQYRSILRVNEAISKSSEILNQLIGPEIYEEGNTESNLATVDREYVDLYRRTLQVPGMDLPSLSPDDEARLNTLELSHTADEVKFYRKSVLNELDEYLVRRSGQTKYEIFRKRDVRPQGGFSSVLSWFKSSKSDQSAYEGLLPSNSEIDIVLETPIVEEDEEKALSTIFSQMSFKIPEISLTLIGDKGSLLHGAIVGSELKATALNVSTMDLELTVSKISLSNLHSKEAAFPELLYPSSSDTAKFGGSPLLHLLIRVNPADLPAKFAVFGGIEPIDVVVDYVLIQNVLPFFSYDADAPVELQQPEQTNDSLNIILSLTAASPKDMALLRRPSIIVDLKISAPTILVPQRPLEKDTLLLVVDLGCFFVSTRPVSGSTTDVDLSTINVSDMKDVENPLYRRFYDNFTLEYKNLQIFLSEHGEHWRSFYEPESTESKLLCPVSSSLFLGLCVVVESGPLPTLVVNIHFKPLTVQMSPNDLKEIMVISTGFQALAQTEVTSSEKAITASTPAKPSGVAMPNDQSIPADLALKLSGKETDIDAFINVFLEKLHLVISVDSKTIINAAIDGVAVDLTKRTFDTSASFSIHDMYVEECLSRTKLIQSYLPTALVAPEDVDSRHFIHCRYVQTDRNSPSFQEINHLVEISAGLLELNLEPTSLYESALFIKTLLDAVSLPPDVVDSVQSAFDKDYLTAPEVFAEPQKDSKTVEFSVHSKLDGVMLRALIQKNPILEASIRRIFCDVTKNISGCIKSSVKLDTVRIEDCLAPIDSIFRHILVSAEELEQLLVLDVEYYQERLDIDCKLDGMTLLFRTALVQELLDLVQFSPISRISAVFVQAPSEDEAASEVSENAASSSEVKPGRINLHFGQLQLRLAPDDNVDMLFTVSVKNASAQTQRSEIIIEVFELQALVTASNSAPLANIMTISWLKAIYDANSPELLTEPDSFSVKLDSSPLSLLAGTNEYIALLELYNSYIEVKPVIIREAYSIVETPISLPPLQKSIAAVLPALYLTVDKIFSKMSKRDSGIDLNLNLNGKIQVSLQSTTGKQDALTLCSGFSFAMDMNASDAWNAVTSLDAMHISRQANDITMSILRPTDLSLNIQSVKLSDSNRVLNIDVEADQIQLALSYSSILLCRNSGTLLMQAFSPVLDSLNRKNIDEVESGDSFPVPAKIDIPTSIDKEEAVVAWDLTETFNLSLRSIRIDIANDIISSKSARRLPVLELLIAVDPKTEGHGYGNVRHMYLGLVLSAKIYNSKVSAWEPFLEPTAVSITSRQTATMQELSIGISEKFDINISDRMLSSFMDSYQSFLTALTAPTTVCTPESLSVANREHIDGGYTIMAKNDLEIPIKVFFEIGAQTHEVNVNRFSTNVLPVLDESVKLHFSVGDDWMPIKDISINRVGAQSFWVIGSNMANKNNSVRVITEIADSGSSKMLLIHSDRQVQNLSPVTVDIAGFEIKPEQSLWLPAFSHDPSSILYISVPGSNSKSTLDFSKESSWLTFDVKEKGRLVCLHAERRKELCSSFAILLKPSRLALNLLPIRCSFLCTARDHTWKDQTLEVSSGNHHGLTMEPNKEFEFQFMLPFMESWSFPVLVNGDSTQTVTVMHRNANKLNINVEVQSDNVIVFVGYWVYDLVQLPDNIQLQISSEQSEFMSAVLPEAEIASESEHLNSLVEPMMFHSESGRAYLKLSLTNAKWSNPYSIQAAGSSEVVMVIAGIEAYQFNVNTSLCMAPFTRTKKVVFTPRYIIVNSLHFPILYKQNGDSLECRLESGETRPLYKWPRFDLSEELCVKKDDPLAFWTSPISVSDVTDETLTLQGSNWLRLARFEVQRGNSAFLLLSHQKPSLVPLVVLNRTVCCDVWVRQKGHVTWRHLVPESGYPFGIGERSQSIYVSLKFGRTTTSGAEIVRRMDLDLSNLKDNESVFSWDDSATHNIVVELEERGPFLSIVISERLLNRDALCSSISSVHATINNLVSQWTSKKIELTELAVDSNRYLQLYIIECSQLDVPYESRAVYLSMSAFTQTVLTPAVADISDPYFGTKHVFAVDGDILEGSITFCIYLVTSSNAATLFCKFDIPIELSDKWFDINSQGRSVGRIHVAMRAFESKSELLKEEMQGLNVALLKQQDIVKELDAFMESAPAVIQMQSDLVADPNLKSEFIEYQLLPIEVRGQDVPQTERQRDFPSMADLEDELKAVSPRASSTREPPSSHRLVCDFKANVGGPDGDSHSAVLLTNWSGEQIARVLKELFSVRVLNNQNSADSVSVEITLKQEERQRGKCSQYRIIDRVVLPLSQALDETWVKFDSGNNEICLTIIRSLIEIRQRDLFKPVSQIQLFCNQIGVSLIDRMSREIMYICILKTYLNIIDTSDQLGLQFYIGSLQSDNQTREALYPVVIFPKGAGNKDKNRIPWLQAAVLNLKDKQNEGFINLPYLSLLLQETNFYVEEELVWSLYEYANNMADILKPLEPVSERRLGLNLDEYRVHPLPGSTANVYIKSLILHPVALNITFQPDVTRREKRRYHLVSRYANPIDMLLGAAGVTLGSIKDAPIRVDSLEVFDVFGSWETLFAPIKMHYIIQLLQQAYKLFGSLSVLGNPVGLVSNLGQGVKHLFYDPAQGLVSSPLDFGKGLATGSRRFVQHTVGGVLSSAGQITSSLSTGVAVLTMDRTYLQKREKDERKRIRAAAQGTESHNIATGLVAFGSGLIGGIRGAVEKPVAGLKKGGALGFLKGIVKGGAALIAQPIVGVIDLGTHTVQGIQSVIGRPTRLYGVSQCRLPRFITKSGVLDPYNALSSKGQSVLWASGKLLGNISIPLTTQQRRQESLISCKDIRITQQPAGFRSINFALTSFRIIAAEFDSDSSPPTTILFSIGYDQIDSMSHSPADDQFSLILTDGRAVPIKTRSSAEADEFLVWIVEHLDDCAPIIRHATYGSGNCWITITDLLQSHVASLGRIPVVAVDQIQEMIRQQSGDFFTRCIGGHLWVEYTRGPDMITAEFDLIQPVAF